MNGIVVWCLFIRIKEMRVGEQITKEQSPLGIP